MKNEAVSGKVYSKLIRKLFYQTIAVLGLSVILVIVLRSALRGKVADALVQTISTCFRVDWDFAHGIYQYYIRNNLDLIVATIVVVFFFIFFRLSLSWFTRYFDQIVTAVDQLGEEVEEKITMCSELEFIETKLNEAKDKLKKRAEDAQAAEQRKNDLVVYLAHDIKTPLTSVIGYLSLINEARDMPAEQRANYVDIALNKAYRLETLINDFFEITRYNLQSVPLHTENINLCYMMVQIADEMYPQLAESEKQVNIKVAEDIVIYGDSQQLARVFNNILKNAITYGAGKSTINISAETAGNKAIIYIENQGAIPEDQVSSIFDKFYRLDAARSSATGGSGLGLAIAKDIITLHEGTIRAESDNQHTVFIVELPLDMKAVKISP